VASLSQGRTAAAQCGLFTHKSVPVIFEPPCTTAHPKNQQASCRYTALYILVFAGYVYSFTKLCLSPYRLGCHRYSSIRYILRFTANLWCWKQTL